jgi:type II secretory ATPase GspE/PulE/Tfp pilus assembly ATPase PilB-like protein
MLGWAGTGWLLSQGPVLSPSPCHLVTLSHCHLLALFPRGDGFYFDPVKLLLVAGVYLAWVRVCWWVDQDARALKQKPRFWNPLVLAGGLLGLLMVWLVPFFPVSFGFLVLFCVGPALVYVSKRNEAVDPEDRVLTIRHLRELGRRWLRLPGKADAGPAKTSKGVAVRFISKSGGREQDASRAAQAHGSTGYQAALDLVHEAVDKRATDIHLEPTKDDLAVRLRIDGIMRGSEAFSRDVGDAVLNIFKVLADMDITEKRKPQDGSFSAEVQGDGDGGEGKRLIDFRVATAGSVAGEKMVMRLLDRSRRVDSLSQVGMRDRIRDEVRRVVAQPHGMLIVCGPTGSGKSTTLYACLSEIDRYQKNVITLENPVEYQIDNVTQIEVNPKAGKTFAGELRSILRQDPNVIYIGEIRDQETAEIACQAAQTGHMVFTTLHANDTSSALQRLADLGVKPALVASAVSGVLGQRLVRVLCPKCKKKYRPDADRLRKLNLPADKIKFFYGPARTSEEEPDGEPQCRYCGDACYRGRTGVFELLVVTDKIRELIREGLNVDAIRQEAVKAGMRPLYEDGLRQVIEGETSIQELLRVCK